MVTDEERDYMYRVYATDPRARINLGIRRRLAPLLRNNRRKIELINACSFRCPARRSFITATRSAWATTSYLGDRNGVRTPMQWSPDRNAGFSRANPQQLYLPDHHRSRISLRSGQRGESGEQSLVAALVDAPRHRDAQALQAPSGAARSSFSWPDNPKVLAFIRQFRKRDILVVVNLSRFVQFVQFDLQNFAGMRPIEIFSQTEFPIISDKEAFLALARATRLLLAPAPGRDDGGRFPAGIHTAGFRTET